jgi:hypothetical protein
MEALRDANGELAKRLKWHVDRLAGLIGPRHVGRPAALSAAATLIEREFTESGYTVEQQTYLAGGVEVANLIVEIPGTDRADEILVVGAHYDTVPSTPGADDNASAVAVLVEVARLMRRWRPQRSVRFVAFPCEEPPHFYTAEMGSQVHARSCRERGDRLIGCSVSKWSAFTPRSWASSACLLASRGSCDGPFRAAAIFWLRWGIFVPGGS